MRFEQTASCFVVSVEDDELQVCLVWHPRLEGWMPCGGHVEDDEDDATACLREVLEESGLRVVLIPGPQLPAPNGFPHQSVCAPWWTSRGPASPDSHTHVSHFHVDSVFVAYAASRTPTQPPEHEVRWFSVADLVPHTGISEDSRLQADLRQIRQRLHAH